MYGAHSYESVCKELGLAFRGRYQTPAKVRMVGLLFARPTSPLSAADIVPHLEYFHHRSGQNIDFFCAGYGAGWEPWLVEIPGVPGKLALKDGSSVDKVALIDRQQWYFCNRLFISFLEEIRARTSWEYSGGTDLILINARYDATAQLGSIDFNSRPIAMDLDRAKEEKAIPSVEKFFENVIRYAEKQTGDDPTWGFSDQMGKELAGSGFKSLILSLLPEALRADARKAFHFYVRDIAPAKGQ